MRRFFESWRPFRLMYCQSFFVTSVRGIGELPTTEARSPLGCIGFMNAAFGVRFLPEDDLRRLLRPPPPPLLAELFLPRLDDLRDEDFRDEDFLPPFLLVAILSPGLVIRMRFATVKRGPSATQTIVRRGESNRESREF